MKIALNLSTGSQVSVPSIINWQLKEAVNMTDLIPIERIEKKIYFIRGQKVMIDFDLAMLYEIETKYLKRQVNRNTSRFPAEFMFQLTKEEYHLLRCQFGTLKRGKHSKYLPYAFTEHGILMLSSVLNNEKAVQINIFIIKTFIKLRKILSTHKELDDKLKELESKYEKHDVEIQTIFNVIRKLMEPPPEKPKKRIGFIVGDS